MATDHRDNAEESGLPADKHLWRGIPASFTWELPGIFMFTFNALLFAHLFFTPGSGFQCEIHCHFQVDVAIIRNDSRRRNAKQPGRGGEREKPPLASTFTRPKSAKVEKYGGWMVSKLVLPN